MNNNQNNTQKAAEAKNTIDKAAPFGWGLYTGSPNSTPDFETAAFYTKEEAIEAAGEHAADGDTVQVKPLNTPTDWINFIATFEGEDSNYTNDQIQAAAERIEELRKKAKEAGEGTINGHAGEITGVGVYSWDH